MKKGTIFFKIFFLSVLLYVCLFYVNGVRNAIAESCLSLWFMALTWWCCKEYRSETISLSFIGLPLIVGRVIIEIPMRVLDWSGTIYSLYLSIIGIIAILISLVCFQKKSLLWWIYGTAIVISLHSVLGMLEESHKFLF